MRILAICSSTNAFSCAVADKHQLLGESFINFSPTLAESFVLYLQQFLTTIRVPVSTLEGIAVVTGPGSFTNLRVGITTSKIIAQLRSIPIVGLDGLETVARNCRINGTVTVAQKACRNEVNAAVFGIHDFILNRLTHNFSLTIEQLAGKLAAGKGPVYLTGDGASLVYEQLAEHHDNLPVSLAPPEMWEPRASVVAFQGQELLQQGISHELLRLGPVYSHPPNIKKSAYGRNPNVS